MCQGDNVDSCLRCPQATRFVFQKPLSSEELLRAPAICLFLEPILHHRPSGGPTHPGRPAAAVLPFALSFRRARSILDRAPVFHTGLFVPLSARPTSVKPLCAPNSHESVSPPPSEDDVAWGTSVDLVWRQRSEEEP